MEAKAQKFVQNFDRAKKPIAFICDAPWLLISAGLVEGRTLSGYHTIQDDIRNAGGKWKDEGGFAMATGFPAGSRPISRRLIERLIALFSERKARAKSA